MKAIVCVGISGSGKSTFAEEMVVSKGWVEVNRDTVRFTHFCEGIRDWSKYKFNKTNEQYVTDVCNGFVEAMADLGMNIVCSDTNLDERHRTRLIQKLEGLGYEVEIKEFPITLEEAWKRDSKRFGGVGRDILYRQWQKWLKYTGRKTYTPDQNKPKAVLVDIDGTVAKMEGRGPFDWDKVYQDIPRSFIIDIVESLLYDCGYEIIFLSGRDGVCYDTTESWIIDYTSIDTPQLYMRQKGDTRKDTIIKEEIFWEYIADSYNVVAAIDDRPCMIRLWNDIGIPNVISVANPFKEF